MTTGRFARDLAGMAAVTHDLLIVGGGITGAAIARDAALRGLKVALVDKGDFSSGTSASSSKLVHGGLRYLRNLELGLVRESLAERRIWQHIAPHMVRPLPFLLPTEAGNRTRLELGLTLYDWLAFDRGRGLPREEIPARHRFIDWAEAQRLEPVLSGAGGTGAFLYGDCQMYSPERLGLECLLDAAAHGAHVANYAEADRLIQEDDDNVRRVCGARIVDRFDWRYYDVRARLTVNACGPWADGLLEDLIGDASDRLIRSKGIHIVTRPLARAHALTLQVPGALGGGHVFVLPWNGHSLIGTTDTSFEGDPGEVRATAADVAALIRTVNGVLPGVHLRAEDVLFAYAGLRPLVSGAEGNDNTYDASRRSEIVDHEGRDGIAGLVSALGGKWTTSRHLAEDAVDLVLKKLERPRRPCRTAERPLPGAPPAGWRRFRPAARAQHPDLAEETLDHLTRTYGARFEQVLMLAKARRELYAPLCPERPEIGAEIVFAVRTEMARRMGDVIFRRTGLGGIGHPGGDCLRSVAGLMARELHWTGERQEAELAETERRFNVWREESPS
ncbi:MAG: FAD-dependent oxidoreductase [Alphaproteobacteria bacterium]